LSREPWQAVTTTISNGQITANKAESAGGGIYVNKTAKYTTIGGMITGNEAGEEGHDVFKQEEKKE
jgi:hypothetical protein